MPFSKTNVAKNRLSRLKHYYSHKEYYLKKNRDRKLKIRTWIIEYKSKLKCSKCDENNPFCLDFHHVNSIKEISIGQVTNRGWSINRIEKEIEKCIVLCSNCHRKEHHKAVA